MKIYIVTDGCYSNYHIVAVFKKRTSADQYIENNGGDVEEWSVDALKGAIKRRNYRYILPSGKSWYFEILARPHDRISSLNAESKARKNTTTGEWSSIGDSLVSSEHARKLAVEKIQAAQRKHAWHGRRPKAQSSK